MVVEFLVKRYTHPGTSFRHPLAFPPTPAFFLAPARREVQANLVINNLLNDRGPLYSSNSFTTAPVRPKNNDYTSPARETVPIAFALKQPISYSLTLTMKL